jgi:hypothetical protein
MDGAIVQAMGEAGLQSGEFLRGDTGMALSEATLGTGIFAVSRLRVWGSPRIAT